MKPSSRRWEFVLVLVLVAVVAVALRARWASPELAATPREPLVTESPMTASSPVAAIEKLSSKDELIADFENADGMTGCNDVLALEVPPILPNTLEQGRELFKANCATCHGESALGDGQAASALDPKPANLRAPGGYKYGSRELAIYRTAMYGIEGTGMVGWEGILEPNDVWAITHYVRSIQDAK